MQFIFKEMLTTIRKNSNYIEDKTETLHVSAESVATSSGEVFKGS
jgi:hypothetical protein